MRIKSIFTLSVLLLTGFPLASRAEAPSDAYADALYAYSTYGLYQASNATGAPDGAYAEFFDALTSLTLDMGENEEGMGDLTMTYQIQEAGATYQVDFLDEDLNVLKTASAVFQVPSTETTIAYSGAEAYRYVKVTCAENEEWKLDAVAAASIAEVATPDAAESETAETDAEEESEEPSSPRGMIVKLLDDGDASTTVDASVYVIDDNGMRHAFPSLVVFNSWYEDFDDIAYIDPENLAAYALGNNVTVRPGTWLVKITTDPKVYVVESGGTLRWITTEEIAESLYGADWNRRVIDVPDTLWGNYTVGEPITTEVHPAGTLGVIQTGEIVYLDADHYYSIGGDVYSYMRFTSDFSVTVSDEKLERYDAGGLLQSDPDIAFPY